MSHIRNTLLQNIHQHKHLFKRNDTKTLVFTIHIPQKTYKQTSLSFTTVTACFHHNKHKSNEFIYIYINNQYNSTRNLPLEHVSNWSCKINFNSFSSGVCSCIQLTRNRILQSLWNTNMAHLHTLQDQLLTATFNPCSYHKTILVGYLHKIMILALY